MQTLGWLMRVFSFVFHLLLGLAMIGISSIAWVSGQHTLQIGFLPWKGPALTHWLFFAGLAGVIITILAIRRVIPFLFLLWSLAVAVMFVRGYLFTGFNFGYTASTLSAALKLLLSSTAFWVLLASLLAAVGSVAQLRGRRQQVRRRTAVA